MTTLKTGPVRYTDSDGAERYIFVSGGFAEALPDKVTILAESAEKQGDGSYILDGSKNFITCGPEAEHTIIFAITARDGRKVRHTALIVKRGMDGFTLAPHDEKLGIRAAHSCAARAMPNA